MTPNTEPKSYWTRANGSNHIKKVLPVRGNSLFLDHLMPSRISSVTLRTLHNTSKRLYSKHFLVRNAGNEYDDEKRELRVRSSSKGTVAQVGCKWEEAETLYELVDGVKNYVGAIHMIRGFSYEALALDRALHQIRYFARPAETANPNNPGKAQLELSRKLFNDVLLNNSNAGREGRPPATYEKVSRVFI